MPAHALQRGGSEAASRASSDAQKKETTLIYFNEIDGFMAQWCRNAFEGLVDERDIREIEEPVIALRQHYFAGLGGWEHALRLAGWPADREVWTGSVPCQPWSVAGKGQAADDERDLWPAFFHLITIGQPSVVIGEQVTGALAYGWFDRVCDDLEGVGYACGASVLPAASVGAPHIRARLYWCAIRLDDTGRLSHQRRRDAGDVPSPKDHAQDQGLQRQWGGNAHSSASATGGLAVAESPERQPVGTVEGGLSSRLADGGGLGDSDGTGPQGRRIGLEQRRDQLPAGTTGTLGGVADADDPQAARQREYGGPGLRPAPSQHWAASGSIDCADGRSRRVPLESGFQPLADGGRFGNPRTDPHVSSRIAALQGAGNAICIPLAAEFIRAVMDLL